MNLPFLRRMLPVITFASIGLVLIILPNINSPMDAEVRYATCSRLVANVPAQALAWAERWRASRPDSLPAKHCEALALFATRDYARAADAFASLAKEAMPGKPTLAARLLLQEARSLKALGKHDAATTAATAAQTLDSENPEARALLADIAKEKATPAPVPATGSSSR
jgi:hypothetical protein